MIDAMWLDLVAAWPAVNGVRVEYTWACFRPAHPDHLPVIDRVPEVDNAWITTGHYKTGILMAAGTARAIAEWIATDSAPAWTRPFALTRPSLRRL